MANPNFDSVDVIEEEGKLEAEMPKSFDQQFLRQMENIAKLACVEFLPGRDDKVLIMANGVTKDATQHFDDTQEIYCNAVQHMRDFVDAHLHYFNPRKNEEQVAKYVYEWDDKKPKENSYKTHEEFKAALVEYYREMFRRILRFAYVMNYFSRTGSYTDGP